MQREFPNPLTPPDCDLTDFPGMMLDIPRLRKSGTWRQCKRRPELAFYVLNLWTASWHEVPAASLEDNDEALADAAMCSDDLWPTLKLEVMRGWVLCADGRWYHEIVAIKALEAWIEKLGSRISSGCGNASRWKGSFDASHLRTQLALAKDLLAALDPLSKVFGRKRAVVTSTAEKPARTRKPRAPKAAQAGESAGGIPPGAKPDPVGVPIERDSERDSDSERNVGGIPPTTPSAGAPVDQAAAEVPDEAKLGKRSVVYADKNLVLPAWLAPHADDWKAFEQLRWAKHPRAPYTAEAQRRVLLKLEGMHNDGQDLHVVLDTSITGGWTDVYPQKLQRGGGGGGGSGSRFTAAATGVFGAPKPQGGGFIDV